MTADAFFLAEPSALASWRLAILMGATPARTNLPLVMPSLSTPDTAAPRSLSGNSPRPTP